MPTRWRETFGLVAAEAAMSGVPVIASVLAPIAVDLEQIGAGLSCDPADEQGLADQIQRLIDDDELAAQMSSNGFNLSHALSPNPSQWCDRLLALYARKIAAASALRVAR